MPSNFFEDSTYEQHVRLRLSAKSASQPVVFFSHKKPTSSTFSQPDQPKRTGWNFGETVNKSM
jgi:hypothetical protein